MSIKPYPDFGNYLVVVLLVIVTSINDINTHVSHIFLSAVDSALTRYIARDFETREITGAITWLLFFSHARTKSIITF